MEQQFFGVSLEKLLTSGGQTLYMVALALIIGTVIGIVLALILVLCKKGGLAENLILYNIVSIYINIVRSIPFVILIVAIMPITRAIVGTTIGSTAALVPLVVYISPYLARLMENSLLEVNPGILEAAEAIADEGITLLKNEGNALPLASGTKLNVFGWSSVAPVYGGAGSGSSDSSKAASLLDGLHEAGFETNTELENFYTNFRSERPSISFFGVDFTIPEPTMEEFQNANIFENAKAFSDTALVVIGRSSGEGSDLAMNLSDDNNFTIGENGEHVTFSTQEDDLDAEKSYLELSNREIAMLDEVTKDFKDVIVVINSAQPMELGWLDQYDNIKGAIYCPSPGQVGFRSLGKILSGEVNPSGKLTDTWAVDYNDYPSSAAFSWNDAVHKDGETTEESNAANTAATAEAV